MLPRKLRFTTRLFDRVFRRSKKVRIGEWNFLVSPVRGEARFSVVAGKKVSKSAVKRNKIRRQIYPIIREKLMGKMDNNVIFLYKGPAEFTKHKSLADACEKLVSQLSKNDS